VLVPALSLAQTPAPPPAAPPPATAPAAPAAAPASKEQLEQLLAPIALYPDSLLSQVLMAATYPADVADAAKWVKAHPDSKGDAAVKAVQGQSWDPSVQSLAAFPQILDMMGGQPDWVQKLGDAFLASSKDVLDAVQRLRQKAQKAGNLKSSEQQKVIVEQEPTTQQTIIKVEPAQPETVYVPAYNPTVVYGAWPYPSYPPYYYPPSPYYYPARRWPRASRSASAWLPSVRSGAAATGVVVTSTSTSTSTTTSTATARSAIPNSSTTAATGAACRTATRRVARSTAARVSATPLRATTTAAATRAVTRSGSRRRVRCSPAAWIRRRGAMNCATTRRHVIARTRPRRAACATVVRLAVAASRRVRATGPAAPATARCAAPAMPEPRVNMPIVATRAAHRREAMAVVPEPAMVVVVVCAVAAVAAVVAVAVASNQESA
jgi:hypothetical protein